MDGKLVRQLETRLEAAIAEALDAAVRRELPLHPSQRTVHLMAKAAVTVYETAVENQTEISME